ncbi:MAG: TlpA disulfide reductase family protein [Planctomycetota bacterium]|nr:TlpA disulfide reductase family protein [Planctomycetota bacterium]
MGISDVMDSSHMTRHGWRWACLFLVVAWGCQQSTDPASEELPGVAGPAEKGAALSAKQVLEKLVETYQAAECYQDHGEVTLRYRMLGSLHQETAQLVTRWSSPGNLYIRCYQLEVACRDGQLTARMHDETTADLDGQLVSRPIAKKLSLADFFSDDSLLLEMLYAGRVGLPLSAALLAEPEFLAGQLGAEAELELLEEKSLGKHECYRLKVITEDTPFVLWIDKEELALRRQEFPADLFAADLLEVPGVSEISLQVDFHAAEFPAAMDESSFQVSLPANARTVGRFILPPPPPVTDLYGRRPGRFELVDADDGVVTRDSLRGRNTVLLWCQADESCRQAARLLDEISASWPESEDLQVFTVFVDPEEIPTGTLTARLRKWEVSLPLLRDLDGQAGEALQVQFAPTLVLLNSEGTVQAFLPAIDKEQLGNLDGFVRELRQGHDLAAVFQQQQQLLEEKYQQDLLAAAQQAAANLDVAERAQPQRFLAEEAWVFEAATAAGNMLMLPAGDDGFEVLVLDDGKEVIQLDREGARLATHPLPVQDGREFMLLRTATSRLGGRRFAVMTPGSQQVLVLDAKWQEQLAYPDPEQEHDGISQVVLTDLEDDGELELYVAFWGLAGVHRVEMDGTRRWGYRGVTDVISLVASPRNDVGWQKLLLTDQQGRLSQLNQFGNADPAVDTGGVPFHHLFPGNLGTDAITRFCALSSTQSQVMVGLDMQLRTRWRYPVVLGTFATQVEMVAATSLASQDAGVWLIATAHGVVHMVAHDGSFADMFAVGERITGISAGHFSGETWVLIASGKKVTCWKITTRE